MSMEGPHKGGVVWGVCVGGGVSKHQGQYSIMCHFTALSEIYIIAYILKSIRVFSLISFLHLKVYHSF